MRTPVLFGILACWLSMPPAANAQNSSGQPNGASSAPAALPAEEGIPVTDPLTIAKCEPCHRRDERGNMERISWERTTPEGWQEALKKMPVGSSWQLFVPPELGYGVEGLPPSVGPDAMLIYELQLVGIKAKASKAKPGEAPGRTGTEPPQ